MSIPIIPGSMAPPCTYCTPERLKKSLQPIKSFMTFQETFTPEEGVQTSRQVRSVCSNCFIKVFDAHFKPKIEVTR